MYPVCAFVKSAVRPVEGKIFPEDAKVDLPKDLGHRGEVADVRAEASRWQNVFTKSPDLEAGRKGEQNVV